MGFYPKENTEYGPLRFRYINPAAIPTGAEITIKLSSVTDFVPFPTSSLDTSFTDLTEEQLACYVNRIQYSCTLTNTKDITITFVGTQIT